MSDSKPILYTPSFYNHYVDNLIPSVAATALLATAQCQSYETILLSVLLAKLAALPTTIAVEAAFTIRPSLTDGSLSSSFLLLFIRALPAIATTLLVEFLFQPSMGNTLDDAAQNVHVGSLVAYVILMLISNVFDDPGNELEQESRHRP